MKIKTVRLKQGEDLRDAIEQHVLDQDIDAGCILTCVGSLMIARLRLANASVHQTFQGPFEIVSLVGTLGRQGVHLHISLSDNEGSMVGGHLVSGCKIHTTAEIVLGEISGVQFARVLDPQTGYKELEVRKNLTN